MFETKSGVLLIAGLGFFSLAFLSNGLVPWLMYSKDAEQIVEQTIEKQLAVELKDQSDLNKLKIYRQSVMSHFKLLTELYKESFEKYYEPKMADEEKVKQVADMIRRGRNVYIAEGCWHCHSQFIRPVSNEEKRFGPVSKSWEYQNEAQRPVMFGTRRVKSG